MLRVAKQQVNARMEYYVLRGSRPGSFELYQQERFPGTFEPESCGGIGMRLIISAKRRPCRRHIGRHISQHQTFRDLDKNPSTRRAARHIFPCSLLTALSNPSWSARLAAAH